MKNVLMLTKASLLKSKSQAISLILFVTIAAIFLYMGLVIYFGMGRFFDERAEQLKEPHYIVVTNNIEKISFIENYSGVMEVEKQNIIAGSGDYGASIFFNIMFARVNDNLKISPLTIIEEFSALEDDSIYLTNFIMLNHGFSVGDSIIINFSGIALHFTVAGSVENIVNRNNMVYVSDETFNRLKEQFPNNHQNLISVRMENNEPRYAAALSTAVDKILSSNEVNATLEGFSRLYINIKRNSLQIAEIAAILITLLALILLAVSLIVIRFRIINNIEENMANIGVLKAIGYRSVQIISSIILQFGILALTGGLLGITVAIFILPVITGIIEPVIGLRWNPIFDFIFAFTALSVTLLMVLTTALLSSRRISKLHPLVALRGGISTHSFKKNPMPLESTRAPLTLALSLKQILRSKKQAVMIIAIMASLMFSSVTGITIHYNMNVENDSFIRAIAGETPDVLFVLNDNADGETFAQKLKQHPQVRKALGFDSHSESTAVFIGDEMRTIYVVEDFTLLEGSSLTRGRYPRHNNEIALSMLLMELHDINIGDTITLRSPEAAAPEKEYYVSGIIQTMSYGGLTGYISQEGFREIMPDFKSAMIYVYLTEGINQKSFMENIVIEEEDIFSVTRTYDEMAGATLGGAGDIFAAVAVITVSVTVIIVILVLYLVIKTFILRGRRELGIQKAVGFTTLQLMNQIALNLTPVISAGVLIGAVAGYFGLNPLFVLLMRGMGIAQANLPIPLDWIIMTCVALFGLAYGISMLIAWRIRRITAYSLVSE